MMSSKVCPSFVASVVGLSLDFGESFGRRAGCGKSCLCYRFVHPAYDDYIGSHQSLYALHEFESRVINNDHFLYWGSPVKIFPTTDASRSMNMRVHVLEHTVFYQDITCQPFTIITKPDRPECYVKRITGAIESPAKLSYRSRDEVSSPEEYQAEQYPSGISKLSRGFILVVDVSLKSDAFEKQLKRAEKILEYLTKHKRKNVIAAAKRDTVFIPSLEKVYALKKKYHTHVVEVSAEQNLNVSECFRLLAYKLFKNSFKLSSQVQTYPEAARLSLLRKGSARRSFGAFLKKRVLDPNERASAIALNQEYLECAMVFGKYETDKLFAMHVLEVYNEKVDLFAGVKENPEMREEFLEDFVEQRSDLSLYTKELRDWIESRISELSSTVIEDDGDELDADQYDIPRLTGNGAPIDDYQLFRRASPSQSHVTQDSGFNQDISTLSSLETEETIKDNGSYYSDSEGSEGPDYINYDPKHPPVPSPSIKEPASDALKSTKLQAKPQTTPTAPQATMVEQTRSSHTPSPRSSHTPSPTPSSNIKNRAQALGSLLGHKSMEESSSVSPSPELVEEDKPATKSPREKDWPSPPTPEPVQKPISSQGSIKNRAQLLGNLLGHKPATPPPAPKPKPSRSPALARHSGSQPDGEPPSTKTPVSKSLSESQPPKKPPPITRRVSSLPGNGTDSQDSAPNAPNSARKPSVTPRPPERNSSGPPDQRTSGPPTSVKPSPEQTTSGPPTSVKPPPEQRMSGPPTSVKPPPEQRTSGPPTSVKPSPERSTSGPPTSVKPPPERSTSVPPTSVKSPMPPERKVSDNSSPPTNVKFPVPPERKVSGNSSPPISVKSPARKQTSGDISNLSNFAAAMPPSPKDDEPTDKPRLQAIRKKLRERKNYEAQQTRRKREDSVEQSPEPLVPKSHHAQVNIDELCERISPPPLCMPKESQEIPTIPPRTDAMFIIEEENPMATKGDEGVRSPRGTSRDRSIVSPKKIVETKNRNHSSSSDTEPRFSPSRPLPPPPSRELPTIPLSSSVPKSSFLVMKNRPLPAEPFARTEESDDDIIDDDGHDYEIFDFDQKGLPILPKQPKEPHRGLVRGHLPPEMSLPASLKSLQSILSPTRSTKQPQGSAIPQQPRVSASPQQPRTPAIPQQPRGSASPQQPRASAIPQQPRASASPHQPRASIQRSKTFNGNDKGHSSPMASKPFKELFTDYVDGYVNTEAPLKDPETMSIQERELPLTPFEVSAQQLPSSRDAPDYDYPEVRSVFRTLPPPRKKGKVPVPSRHHPKTSDDYMDMDAPFATDDHDSYVNAECIERVRDQMLGTSQAKNGHGKLYSQDDMSTYMNLPAPPSTLPPRSTARDNDSLKSSTLPNAHSKKATPTSLASELQSKLDRKAAPSFSKSLDNSNEDENDQDYVNVSASLPASFFQERLGNIPKVFQNVREQVPKPTIRLPPRNIKRTAGE